MIERLAPSVPAADEKSLRQWGVTSPAVAAA
jgi:hypothetical protein